MQESRTNLENIVDNLYYRAEKAGTIEFDTEEKRDLLKRQLIELYKEYRELIAQRNRAGENARTIIYKTDSKETRKYKREQIKVGKKEGKALQKQIEAINKKMEPYIKNLDISQIGGKDGAMMMLQTAFNEDRDEENKRRRSEERNARLEQVCPKAKVEGIEAIDLQPGSEERGKNDLAVEK